MDITTISDEKIKALLYDQITTIANAQKVVERLQQELVRRQNAPRTAPIAPKVTPTKPKAKTAVKSK
jgi:hypothetical protein